MQKEAHECERRLRLLFPKGAVLLVLGGHRQFDPLAQFGLHGQRSSRKNYASAYVSNCFGNTAGETLIWRLEFQGICKTSCSFQRIFHKNHMILLEPADY